MKNTQITKRVIITIKNNHRRK